MCGTLSKIYSHLTTEETREKSEGSASKWYPLKIAACSKKMLCEEPVIMLASIAGKITSKIRPVIDPKTCPPIEEVKFRRENRKLCELAKIVKISDCEKTLKVKLISVPKEDIVFGFINDTLRHANATKEVALYAFILLERLLKLTQWQLRSTNWRILWLILLRLAQKMESQRCMRVEDIHNLYPLVETTEYLRLEALTFRLLGNNCSVSLEKFAQYMQDCMGSEAQNTDSH